MEIRDLITTESIVPNLKVTNKKQALQELAVHVANICGQHERAIFDVLMERERLGTTGVGNGIAIPHGKLPRLKTLFGVFASLEKPIDFQAIDERPVDLIFLLLLRFFFLFFSFGLLFLLLLFCHQLRKVDDAISLFNLYHSFTDLDHFLVLEESFLRASRKLRDQFRCNGFPTLRLGFGLVCGGVRVVRLRGGRRCGMLRRTGRSRDGRDAQAAPRFRRERTVVPDVGDDRRCR